jgi:hypothetical protein
MARNHMNPLTLSLGRMRLLLISSVGLLVILLPIHFYGFKTAAHPPVELALSDVSTDRERSFSIPKVPEIAQNRVWSEPVQKPKVTFMPGNLLDIPVVANDGLARKLGISEARPSGYLAVDLTGNGVVIGLWDAKSPLLTHTEFGSRVSFIGTAEGIDNHATGVTGTMVASGINNTEARGMAPAGSVQARSFNNDITSMTSAAGTGLRLSAHPYARLSGWRNGSVVEACGSVDWSWVGSETVSETQDYLFGYYHGEAASWDQLAYDYPYYLMVKSAGNQHTTGPAVQPALHCYYDFGNSMWTTTESTLRELNGETGASISYASVSKNVVVVGSANLTTERYDGPASVVLSQTSSRGPTDDGRIKPDLVAPSTVSVTPSAASDNTYASAGGTSVSAAVVAGASALLLEQYRSLYSRDPLSSTLRALLIHTADETGIGDGPDYAYGWGILNAGRAVRTLQAAGDAPGAVLHAEQELTSAGSRTYTLNHDGLAGLRFTLAWTDPAGTPLADAPEEPGLPLNNRTSMLVNDLDLRVTAPGGTIWQPWRLDPLHPTTPATRGDNAVDNVEQIAIDEANAPAGTWTITVTHKGTLSGGAQTFSLFAGPSDVQIRRFTLAERGWRLISLPHQNVSYSALNPYFFTQGGPGNAWASNTGNASNLMHFSNENANVGYYPVEASGGTFRAGHGYLLYMFAENPAGLPQKNWLPATWVTHGPPSGDLDISIQIPPGDGVSAADPAYFLAGNPYALPLDWQQVYTDSEGLSAGIALWNPQANTGGGTSGFVYFSSLLDTGDPKPIITPHTGFFVHTAPNVNTEPGQAWLRFRPSQQVSGSTPSRFGKESGTPIASDTRPRAESLVLQAQAGEAVSDVRLVWYDEARNGFDRFDIPRMPSLDAEPLVMSVLADGKNLVWDVRPGPDAPAHNADSGTKRSDAYDIRICQASVGPVRFRLSANGTAFRLHLVQVASDTSINEGSQISVPVEYILDETGQVEVNPTEYGIYDTCFRVLFKPSTDRAPLSIVDTHPEVPAATQLHPNFPNPFNPSTTISFDLHQTGLVRLEVFDLTGRQVASVFQGELPSGTHQFIFDARDLASGLYIYQLTTPHLRLSRSFTLIK